MFERINSDINGNPRHVVHFLDLEAPTDASRTSYTLTQRYERTLKKARELGGKRHNTKHYGGGVVFQAYDFQMPEIIARVRALGAVC